MTDTALTGVTPQRSEMQQLVHELQSQDREELETLRRENMQLKMAMQLQGASGAKLEERLREAMLNRTVAIATEDALDAGAMRSAASVVSVATVEAGAKRSAVSVASPPKKPARATDQKPCSEECEAAGLCDGRHDWAALRDTTKACIAECRSSGHLDARHLQCALCKAGVHTRKKAVTMLLARLRKGESASQ